MNTHMGGSHPTHGERLGAAMLPAVAMTLPKGMLRRGHLWMAMLATLVAAIVLSVIG